MHCELNSWQDFLDLIYHESLVRDKYNEFISVLEGTIQQNQELPISHDKNKVVSVQYESRPQGAGARVKAFECANQQNSIFLATIENASTSRNAAVLTGVPGVGLPFIAKRVKEHHDNSKTNYKLGSSGHKLLGWHSSITG